MRKYTVTVELNGVEEVERFIYSLIQADVSFTFEREKKPAVTFAPAPAREGVRKEELKVVAARKRGRIHHRRHREDGRTAVDVMLEALAKGPLRRKQLADTIGEAGFAKHGVNSALVRMMKTGKAKRYGSMYMLEPQKEGLKDNAKSNAVNQG